jgi:D-beta-D-heptose 7-phosphate kinase/D-beta-D-heptose 1-phosphate adenosyltransferase
MSSADENHASVYEELLEFSSRFERIKILVVGDVMLDRYWWGTVSRISPEAPVPVVRHERSTLAAGGAANVAANIAGMRGHPLLVGLIGNDEGGRELPQVLQSAGVSTEHLIELAERPTTVKTRIVAHSQHVVRLDNEDAAQISEEQARQVERHVSDLLASAQVVVISDYAKGLLAPSLLQNIITEAGRLKLPVLVDPKGIDYKRYAGATLITPNRAEAAHACGVDASDPQAVETSGERLLDQLDVAACLITLGEEGMMLFRREQPPVHLPAMAREVYDVTGAGDTVIAALSLAIGAGADLLAAARLANLAAGLAVEQVGTTVLSLELLSQHLNSLIESTKKEARGSAHAGSGMAETSSEKIHA